MQDTSLVPGDAAPQFTAVDVQGNEVVLREHDNRHTLIVFLRYSGCPWCNLTIHRLALEQERLKKAGCDIVAFIQSEPQDILENIYGRHQHKPEFPIIADADRTFYKKYHVRESKKPATLMRSISDLPFWVRSITKGFAQKKVAGELFLVPASFLIGPDQQTILSAHYSSSFYDHLLFEEIYSYLYAPAAA